MASCNHHVYRCELLRDFLVEDSDSEAFKVIADALDREIEQALDALVSEVAQNYGVTNHSFQGLKQFNSGMMEVQTLQLLFDDPSSWINQVQTRLSRTKSDGVIEAGLILSDRKSVCYNQVFYGESIQQLVSLIALFRQQGVNN